MRLATVLHILTYMRDDYGVGGAWEENQFVIMIRGAVTRPLSLCLIVIRQNYKYTLFFVVVIFFPCEVCN